MWRIAALGLVAGNIRLRAKAEAGEPLLTPIYEFTACFRKWRSIVFPTGGIALRVTQRYLGTYFSRLRPLIDEWQRLSATLPKNLVHQCGMGRPPGTQLRRFIQPLPQSLGPPDELDLVDHKTILFRARNLSEVKKLIAVR